MDTVSLFKNWGLRLWKEVEGGVRHSSSSQWGGSAGGRLPAREKIPALTQPKVAVPTFKPIERQPLLMRNNLQRKMESRNDYVGKMDIR